MIGGGTRLALEPRLPAAVFSAAIAAMTQSGLIEVDGPWLKLSGHSARLVPADQRLRERVDRSGTKIRRGDVRSMRPDGPVGGVRDAEGGPLATTTVGRESLR